MSLNVEANPFRELFDRVPMGLYRTTPAGEIIDVNPAFLRMIGYESKEALLQEEARSVYLNPEMRKQWLAEMEAHDTVSGFIAEWKRKDGSIIWVEENAHALRDEHGTILLYEGSAEDITARRELELKLANERAKFEQLFAAAPEAIVLCDNNAVVQRINAEFTRLFGYDQDEALGRAIDALVADGIEQMQSEADDVTDSIASGEITFVETIRHRKDGSHVHVSILGKPVVVDGERVGLYAIYRDITERVEMQTKLAEESARFEQLFDASPEAIVLCDNAGLVRRANREFYELFGFDEQDVLKRHIDEVVATDLNGLHDEANAITQQIADGQASFVETQRKKKDGTLFHVSILAKPIKIEKERVALYGIYRDISARKEAELALAQETARFEQLFSSSPEAVVLCMNNGEVARANEEFYRLFGYAPEEVIGRNIDEVVATNLNGLHDEANAITQQIADGQSSFVETRRRRKDGTLIHVSILGKSIQIDGEQVAIYGIYRDITARKEAELALEASRRKVEQLHEAADALGAAEKEEDVYQITCDAAEQVLGFSLGILCIAEEDEFICRAVSSHLSVDEFARTQMDPVGVAVQAMEEGHPVIVNGEMPKTLPAGIPRSSKSLICAPIGDMGVFQAASQKQDAFSEEDGRLLAILLGHTHVAAARLRLQEQLIKQARHDALTGVFNRHYFNELIAQEVLRSTRYNHPIGLLMCDVDRFKEINDNYGHNVGDMVLKEIAAVLQQTVRQTDMIVRYGGDEFLVVLTETGQDAEEAAERVRVAVNGSKKLREISGFHVTVSVGSIFWQPQDGTSIEEALATADAKMYDDKRSR